MTYITEQIDSFEMGTCVLWDDTEIKSYGHLKLTLSFKLLDSSFYYLFQKLFRHLFHIIRYGSNWH